MSAAAKYLPPLISGTLFGAGLALGGMTDPARVLGFLDIFGGWDPTLAFVMGAASAVMAVAWLARRGMERPVFAPKFSLPSRRDIDLKLAVGAVLFGIGWGLAGICPGPAVALLAIRPLAILPFLFAMLVGMIGHRLLFESGTTPSTKADK